MPMRPCSGISTVPTKLRSRPARMRISVDLPQPEGPISAPVSPSSSAKERSAMTSTLWPAAVQTVFLATRASSRARSPTGDMTFKGLHQERFDDEHDRCEGQRIREQQRDVEQLERDVDFETHPVRPAHQLDHQHDFPDEREARAGRGGDERRELRRDDVAQPFKPRKAEDESHFIESGVERSHALTYGDDR